MEEQTRSVPVGGNNMYAVQQVANFFIELSLQDKTPISHLKLQKLVYISHGCSLALRDERLVVENPRAWKYGPVFPVLFEAFGEWGGTAISSGVCDDDGNVFRLGDDEEAMATKACLRKVWDKLKTMSADELSERTHRPGSPWDTALRKAKWYVREPRIRAALMRAYYIDEARALGISSCFV